MEDHVRYPKKKKRVASPSLAADRKKKKKRVTYLNVAGDNVAAQNIAALLSHGSFQQRYRDVYDFQCNIRKQTVKMIMTSVTCRLQEHRFRGDCHRNWRSCEPVELFRAQIVKDFMGNDPSKDKRSREYYLEQKKKLEREVENCQALVIWTDSTSIGFDIIDICRRIKPDITVWRAKISEITAASVKQAIKKLAEPNPLLQQAADVQEELDLRIGFAFTRFQTLTLESSNVCTEVISYGSCEIPTLGFVVERYNEIKRFASDKSLWTIKLKHTIDNLIVEFNWDKNNSDRECNEEYLRLSQSQPLMRIISVTTNRKSKTRPLPLNAVELQTLGSSMLQITAKKTMIIARSLYSKGIISYPCTDTNIFPGDMKLVKLVKLQLKNPEWGAFAQRILETGLEPCNGTKSDQIHPPIHPTKYVTNLEGDEKEVYELVVRHFLACLSRDAIGLETVVNAVVDGEEFTASGLRVLERNYLEIYPYDQWNSREIHAYEEDSTFEPTEVSLHNPAPNKLTEADLIALMEKHKIGTPSDRADLIEKIHHKFRYITIGEDEYLNPTDLGLTLVECYNNMDPHLVTPEYREQFAADMKLICANCAERRKDSQVVLQEQVEKYKNLYQVMVDNVDDLVDAMRTYLEA